MINNSRWIALAAMFVSVLAFGAEEETAKTKPDESPLRLVTIDIQVIEVEGTKEQWQGDDAKQIERIHTLVSEGKAIAHTKMQLTALANRPAMFQFGETVAVVTGRVEMGREFRGSSGQGFSAQRPPTQNPAGQGSPGQSSTAQRSGRTAYSTQNTQVGTMIRVEPKVLDDSRMVVDLNLTQSRLLPPKPPADETETPAPITPTQTTFTIETACVLTDGETVLLAGKDSLVDGKAVQTFLLVRGTLGENVAH